MIRIRSGWPVAAIALRIILIMPSFDSAPELQKNALSAKLHATSRSASFSREAVFSSSASPSAATSLRQLRKEGGGFLGTFMLSAILIYLVLAAQFESWRDPFIILLGSVPLALSGALLFSFLGFTTLNVFSQVGLVTLVGLVSKNGILIVEFANKLQENFGASKLKAVIEAATTRLRPILMTSVATVAGHFPLILATGPGAGARNSIGIMLVTGMIIGTVFTLFVVPSIYMLVAKDHAKNVAPPLVADQPERDLARVAV